MPAAIPQALLQKLSEVHRGVGVGPYVPLHFTQIPQREPLPGARPNAGTHGFASGGATALEGVVNLGLLARIGPIAPAGTSGGCSTRDDNSSATNVTLPPLVLAGAAQSTVTNLSTPTSTGVSARTNIANVSLLNGLITADGIQAVSTSNGTAAGAVASVPFDLNGHQSSFVNLTVAGTPIAINPAPNTVIDLAGLGNVTLNEQTRTNGAGAASLTVTMLHIRVTVAGNLFGLPVGAEILVARAYSNFTPAANTQSFITGAVGPVVYVLAGGHIISQTGPLSGAGIGCSGGGSHGQVATVSFPGVLNSGTATQDAAGIVQDGVSYTGAITSLQNLNLLAGLLTLDAATSRAYVSSNGINFGDTQFVNIKLQGVALPLNPAPNTVIDVLGLLRITLNEQFGTTNPNVNFKEVVPIDIQVLQPFLGLGTGTKILVGDAVAQTSAF